MEEELYKKGKAALFGFLDYFSERRLIEDILQLSGFSVLDCQIIRKLGEGQKISAIRQEAQVPPSTFSYALDKLEREGYISRGINPNDRRSFDIGLTESGKAALDTLKVGQRRATRLMLSPLLEYEKAIFIELFSKITQGL